MCMYKPTLSGMYVYFKNPFREIHHHFHFLTLLLHVTNMGSTHTTLFQ